MTARYKILAGLAATLLLSGGTVALAGDIGLAWNSSTGASGYKVHYGTSPGSYTSHKDVGNVTTTTLTGLGDCSNYYFAVTAYNAAGESGYSNEVQSWTRPRVTAFTPGSTLQGRQFTMTFDGGSFRPGSTIELQPSSCWGDPNTGECSIVLGTPTITCNRVQLAVTVEPTAGNVQPAGVGTYSVVVKGPDGFDTPAQSLRVDVDPARFDVNQSDDVTRNRLDGKDVVWLARVFGTRINDAQYDPDFDFDGDGWVDGNDLAYYSNTLGKCWTGSTWSVNACPAGLK